MRESNATATPTDLKAGAQFGTLRYLAPECAPVQNPASIHSGSHQAYGSHIPAGTDSDNHGSNDMESTGALIARDVYAWAYLLYELMHEETCFAGLASLDAFFQALSGRRPPLSLPPELDGCAELIEAGWHRDPTRRGTMEATCAVLERLVSGSGEGEASSSSTDAAEGPAMLLRPPSPNSFNTAKIGDEHMPPIFV